jgi:cytochrome c oxidase subunit 2
MLINIKVLIVISITTILTACTYSIDDNQQVIKITAQKYAFSPALIKLKAGKAVILELTSLDRMHGFNIPELNIRTDVLPNQTIQIAITPSKVGKYTFLCDIFCGNGHGEMSGVIIVSQ